MKECGRTTEVYSRVTGYFRPLRNWNAGKQEEFRNRWFFTGSHSSLEPRPDPAPAVSPERATAASEACVCS